LAIALLLMATAAVSAKAQEGPLRPEQPKGITVNEIIQKFAAKEKEFAQARENYTFHQSVSVKTLDDGGNVDGEYQEEVDVTFDDQNRRRENVLFAPQSTLTRVSMTREDKDDIQHRYPFVMTTDQLPLYDVAYRGKQVLDELDTYVFELKPKQIKKDERYFQGTIWVDDHDFQIVKTHGRPAYIEDEKKIKRGEAQQFPAFTTYREQIDGTYWFPTYTRADEILHFPGGRNNPGSDVHIRIVVKYTNYKRFGSKSKIIYEGEEIKKEPPKPEEKK
jgi:outer membrane lipoprotein-sorting protein